MTEESARLDQRLIHVEQEVGIVRSRTHELANKVHELTVLYQDSVEDIKELARSIRAFGEKIDPLISAMAVSTAMHAQHVELCSHDKVRDREITEQHHKENQQSIKQLQFVYYIGIAVVAIATFLGLGQHLLTVILK